MTPEIQKGSDPHLLLRSDVRMLGAILGQVIQDLEGQPIFNRVERLRSLAKVSRDTETSASDQEVKFDELQKELKKLSSKELLLVTRAFTHFLALANIAEQHHRVRRRRYYQAKDDYQPQKGSLSEVFQKLLDDGVSKKELFDVVSRQNVELVLTAHPTEVYRGALLRKHAKIAEILDELDSTIKTPNEKNELKRQLYREISAIWTTEEIRREKPTPLQEAHGGLQVLKKSLWNSVPKHMRELDYRLHKFTGKRLPTDAKPFTFGSWMGGDRDGNPNVTADTTVRAILYSQALAMNLYLKEIHELIEDLPISAGSKSLKKRSKGSIEPYRDVLRELKNKIEETEKILWKSYDSKNVRPTFPRRSKLKIRKTSDLLEPLIECYDSLKEVGLSELANGRLLDVIRKVHVFGLTLVKLDIRQESSLHEEALHWYAKKTLKTDYRKLDEQEKEAFLLKLLSQKKLKPIKGHPQGSTKEVFKTFRRLSELPSDTLGAYIISMAESPSDVLEVELLQKIAGIENPLRVVPLFETLDDLVGAPRTMSRLFNNPWYQKKTNRNQEIMVGYSDSTKDAGRLAAAWALYRAQEDLVEIAKANRFQLTLFHGRGGTVGRGGGPIYLAILSQPPGSIQGSLRVTEQGEMIQSKFGIPGIAERTLELYTTATLNATLRPTPLPKDEWRLLMDKIAENSCQSYRQVLRSDPRFIEYFQKATPQGELGRLNIGSRPSKRKKSGGISSLRAIPWIFAWTQNRLMLPSWLGADDGLSQDLTSDEQATLSEMYGNWEFFQSTIDLIEMVLAKAEIRIAKHYDERLVPKGLQKFGSELHTRFEKTKKTLLEITSHENLLANNSVLKRSIRVRNPYVDPINIVQAHLLDRLRKGSKDPILDYTLLVTMNGIAAGMRNTG